jgi:hypothetical protein
VRLERLTRGHVAAALAALLAVAAVVVLVVVLGRGWWSGSGGGYAPPQAIVATGTVTPRSSLFGDVLTATARVLVDDRRVDPRGVVLDPDFRPYRVLSESKRLEHGVGRSDLVTFDYRLQCIAAQCVDLVRRRTKTSATVSPLQFPPTAVTARSRHGRDRKVRLAWPSAVVQSRVTSGDIAVGAPQIEQPFSAARISWGISPDLLGALLLAGACLLVLGAGWLVASVLAGDTRRLRVLRVPSHLTPVDRALALAEHAAANREYDEGRKALERLAHELRRRGHSELAVTAGRLAWSEDDPSPESVGSLAHAVRSNGAR